MDETIVAIVLMSIPLLVATVIVLEDLRVQRERKAERSE